MILSASRRTDIPCCYPEWMINRLRQGIVAVRNPYRPSRVTVIPLSPQSIDCIVFWTKDPAPLFPYLDEITEYTIHKETATESTSQYIVYRNSEIKYSEVKSNENHKMRI